MSSFAETLNRLARGDVALWSQSLIPTTREAPSDAEMPSHVFLARAGYIRRVGAGVYDYLPLGWRVLRRIMTIIREEHNAAGCCEMLMPVLAPMELFAETGRDEAYGDDLFRLEDRHDRAFALGPTHEEVITELMRGSVTSYKQLPITLYQIQLKFRDEPRPRAGLLRGREFIMKDAYSFHLTVDGPGGLNETYDVLHGVYSRIFERCGLDFTAVEAVAGPIGGSASHEFMVNCESGEDTILVCPKTGYAANVEKCETGPRAWSFEHGAAGDLAKVHTPNMPGIEVVAEAMGVQAMDMLKTVVFETASDDGPAWVLACVRGDHDVNEDKVKSAAGVPVKLAEEKKAREAGFVIGYVSPRTANSIPGTMLLVDPDATAGGSWVTGADEKDHHVRHFNWTRELGGALTDDAKVRVADIRNAHAGDPSPKAEGVTLEERRGIEVGHIFKLGSKYSDAMGLSVLDKDQKRQSVIMGCYGIGVSRTMAACVEMSHDDNGIVWPAHLAPFHVLITVLKPDEGRMQVARDLADELAGKGVDVLIDDRNERPGPKFKDADLIGIPVRVTVSDRLEGQVEFKTRTSEGKGEVIELSDAVQTCLKALG
ncbi:MAG: proline--tRNA ligase [Phycisphaerales bacterium]